MSHRKMLILVLLILLTACNLPQLFSSNASKPTEGIVSSIGMVTAVPNVPGVVISNLNEGAQVPVQSPYDVQFNATGGPFIEADLFVDEQLETSLPLSTQNAQVSGSLSWRSPSSGSHTLRVEVMTAEKNTYSVTVHVVAGSASTVSSSPQTGNANGMQVHFLNLTDGGAVQGTLDDKGKPFVMLQVEVTGGEAVVVTFTANGMPIREEVDNTQNLTPLNGEIKWYPLGGGGDYTLTATAMDSNKQTVSTTTHITVTGVPVFTATPPPMDQAHARLYFDQLYQQLFGISVPAASMVRVDLPQSPNYSRWISAIYLNGKFHYLDLYDDLRVEQSGNSEYGDASNKLPLQYFVFCKPAGTYKVLVAFVDYGNLGVKKEDVTALVPGVVSWLNGLYTHFAQSQGFTSSPMTIQADAVYLSSPPNPGRTINATQVKAKTGVDPAQYNFLLEVDLDANNTTGKQQFAGILDNGGGVALQGCGAMNDKVSVNIWSVAQKAEDVRGVLIMDFNHELSHLFGMMDNYAYSKTTYTDGTPVDDWIPYVLFGWTDTDGDGIPEVLDSTPYGTAQH